MIDITTSTTAQTTTRTTTQIPSGLGMTVRGHACAATTGLADVAAARGSVVRDRRVVTDIKAFADFIWGTPAWRPPLS